MLLAAATAVPIGALAWLGIRSVEQERDLDRQRSRERLEVAAGRIAISIEKQLAEIQEQAGASIRLTPSTIETGAGSGILYRPVPDDNGPLDGSAFRDAERLELRGEFTQAADAYRRLVATADPRMRAAALVRFGRVLRKQRAFAEASSAYRELQKLGGVRIEGQPAELLAHWAQIRMLEDAGNRGALSGEASAFAEALYAGRWPIDFATFDLYQDAIRKCGGPEPPADRLARTEAANALWRLSRAEGFPGRGRRVVYAGNTPVLALWVDTPAYTAWLATPSELNDSLRPSWDHAELAVSLQDFDGRPIFGQRTAGSLALTPGETKLPFVIAVNWPANRPAGNGPLPGHRVLIAGLLFAFALMLTAAYGAFRTTTRELALARQQADFVSSVSHEFRTPLTSLRHMTELLASGKLASEERRTTYYRLLARETDRLNRLVEGLLSFSRIEAGAYALKLEDIEASELARAAVYDFRGSALGEKREVVFESAADGRPVRADRQALLRAVWNLLENAAKYSAGDSPIRVSVSSGPEAVRIAVSDSGAGIPAAEQKRIFEKFVRGENARNSAVSGTGMGLALVKRIAEAHGGSVSVESETGKGSTFTLILPCLAS